MISIVLIRHNIEVIANFEIFFQDQGQFLEELPQLWNWSRRANNHRNPHGMYTNTVLWKQGVKSGSFVFHVRFASQIGLTQNVVRVSIIWSRLIDKRKSK